MAKQPEPDFRSILRALVEGRVAFIVDYEQLYPLSVGIAVADDVRPRVLSLQALIETKQESGRDKDLAVLPLLRRTLEEASGR